MRISLFIILVAFVIASCGKKSEGTPNKEAVTYYITASPGVHSSDSPVSIAVSGSNIESVTISAIHIIEAKYPKGEMQTITLKGIQGDPDLYLTVSKDLTLNPATEVVNKIGKGSITASFKAE